MISTGFNYHEAQMQPPPRRESGPREAGSARILDGVRAFLRVLARWERQFLLPPGAGATSAFIDAESQALSASSLDLQTDRPLAASGRAPVRLSWVFERLHELASSRALDIEVWTMPYGSGADFIGHTSGLPPLVTVVLNDRLQGEELGQTVCHELAIHAWRRARYGITGTITSGGHRDDFHRGVPGRHYAPHHSLADTEADLLALILRGHPPRRRQILPEAQRQHDRHVRQMVDAVIAACLGGDPSGDVLPDLTPGDEYRLWRLYCPAPLGTVLRPTRPLGGP